MPRPTRLEYEGAFHHVMNRGGHRQTIFHDESYYKEFLKTLKDESDHVQPPFGVHDGRQYASVSFIESN